MTIPTISELKGNTILELFKNGYNALKNAITGKQNKLTAGSNIVITDDNVISAIEGGQAVLDNYYTKQEVDDIVDTASESLEDDIEAVANELPDMTQYYTKSETDSEISDAVADKVNADTVYTKSEIDTFIANDVICLDATISDDTDTSSVTRLKISTPLIDGDIITCRFCTGANSGYNVVFSYCDNANINSRDSITNISRQSSTSFYIDTTNFILSIYNGDIRVGGVNNRISYSELNGNSTITETQTWLRPYAQYSSVKIYRRKV